MFCHLYFCQAFARKHLQYLCSSPFPSSEEFLIFDKLQSSDTRVQLWHLHVLEEQCCWGIFVGQIWAASEWFVSKENVWYRKQGFKNIAIEHTKADVTVLGC